MKDFTRIGQRRLQYISVGDPWHCLVMVVIMMMKVVLSSMMKMIIAPVSVDGVMVLLLLQLVRRHFAVIWFVVIVGFHNSLYTQSRWGRRGVHHSVVVATLTVVLLVLPILDLVFKNSLLIHVLLINPLSWYLVEVIDCSGIASARHTIFTDSGEDHTLSQALLEPAILAPIPLGFGDFAVTLRYASVHPLVLHCSLKESFAPVIITSLLRHPITLNYK